MSSTALPRPGEQTLVTVDEEHAFPSVVRDTLIDGLVRLKDVSVTPLRRPFLLPGSLLTVSWRRPDAEYRVSMRLVAADEARGLELVPAGPTERVQRRRHVRGRITVPVTVVGYEGMQWRCVSLDLSESGLRMRLPKDADLKPGSPVMASFSLGKATFVVASEVQWVAVGDEYTHEMGLMFLQPGTQGDQIRRAVFAFQIRHRDASPA